MSFAMQISAEVLAKWPDFYRGGGLQDRLSTEGPINNNGAVVKVGNVSQCQHV